MISSTLAVGFASSVGFSLSRQHWLDVVSANHTPLEVHGAASGARCEEVFVG